MAANKNNKALNVPHLRFPEFTEEWRKYKLSEICSFFSGGTPSSSKKEYYDGSIPFIRSGELHEDQTELFITEDGLKNSAAKMVEVGDLLLALYGATSGDIAISKINGAINQAILCIRTEQHKKFIESIWYKHVGKLLQTYLQGGQGNLSADIVKNISFYFAAIEEQKKLAEFIALLDERIATQNKIIEKLETLIKALSHKLTSQKEPNTLLKNCLVCHSSTLLENNVKEKGKYPVYGATGICGYTDENDISDDAILIIKDGASVGTTTYATGEYSVIGTLNYLQSSQDNYLLPYIYYSLKAFNFAPYITGMAIPHIYFRDYGKAKIWCPDIVEQKRIATALSTMDFKLQIEQNILRNLISQKQYLLSNLFI